MVDLGSLVLLMSIFGWKVAVLYVVLGLVIAVAGGTLIEKLRLENQVEEYIRNGHAIDIPQEELHFKGRMKYAWKQVVSTAKRVAPYVLIGVGIGAIIHNWIPEDFIVKVLGITIRLALCLPLSQVFRCMRIFSAQSRLRKPYLQRALCSALSFPL